MNVQVSTVVMMLLLGSLALIGIGISILIKDNLRNELVAKYKVGVEAFNIAKVRFRGTELAVDVGAGNRVALQRYEGSEAINGFTGDLPAPTAATFGWTALVDATETWVVHQTIDGAVPSAGGSFVIPRLSVAVPASTQLVCTPDNFDGNTGTCPDAFLQAMCHDISGDPAVGQVNKDPAVKGECPRDNVICGTCDFTYYLNTRVEYLVWSGAPESRWRMPANLGWPQYPQGRHYPFNLSDQEFTFEFKNPMNLTLKPIGDPYSLVQNLTGTPMDFGETEDEQRKTGLMMIAIGSLTFLICTGAMAGMRYMTAKANKEKEAAAKEAAKALNDKNAAGGGAPADNNGGVGGDDGAAAANSNHNNPSGGQGDNSNGSGNNGGGGWNGGNGNGGGDQGGWGNGRGGGGDGGGARNPMNQFNDDGNGRGGGGNDGRGGGGGWGNPQRGGRGNNNNHGGGGGGNDDDFKALGPGAAGNRYNNNNRSARGGQDRRGASGYGRGGGGNQQRRNSSGNNSGSGGGGGGSSNGHNQSSGNGSRNARGGGFQSNEDSRSQRSGGSGSAQIAQALRRGPPAGRSSGGHASGGGGGGGRRRSNSRNRQYNRIEDDPDL